MTRSKRAHQLGYPKSHSVHHVPFNAKGDPVRALIDFRGIARSSRSRARLARGRARAAPAIPKDLFAGFLAEPFQGEGGYVPGDPAFFQAVRKVCDETGGLLVCDEVQSVARTGRLFMTEHLGVRPDVLATAKSMVIGITLAGAHLEKHLHGGWHSNTWGSGRILDTNFAWTVLDTPAPPPGSRVRRRLVPRERDAEGERLATALDGIAKRHPGILVAHRGLGLMRGIVVRKREALVHAAWLRG